MTAIDSRDSWNFIIRLDVCTAFTHSIINYNILFQTWFSNRRARFRKSCGYSVSSDVLPPIPPPALNPQPLPFFNFPPPQAPRYPESQVLRYPDPQALRYPNPQFPFFQPQLFPLNALMLLQKLQQK